MTPLEQTGLLSNYWWAVIASDYSVSIFLLVSGVVMLLKIIAVIIPGNRTNSIICLIQGWIYGFPGVNRGQSQVGKFNSSSDLESKAVYTDKEES